MSDTEGRVDSLLQPPPRLLLFDLDDTLCDYAGARAVRLRRAFGPVLDLRPDLDLDLLIAESIAIHPHGTDHFANLLARHGVSNPAVAEAAVTWYRGNRFHGLALFADATETLAALRASDPARRIGVVTNGPADVQRAKIELLGIEQMADFVLVSGEFGVWKPDPGIFLEALRLGGAQAEDTIFIGDSAEHDIAGAQALPMRTVWVNRTGLPWSHSATPPDLEVTTLTALVPLLR